MLNRLGKQHFFVNSEILGMQSWQKMSATLFVEKTQIYVDGFKLHNMIVQKKKIVPDRFFCPSP